MPTTCVISFDNPDGVYYAGQLLRGTVVLTLTKEKKVRGVFVKVYGRAYAYWTEYCSIDHNPTRDSNGNLRSSGGHHVSFVGMSIKFDCTINRISCLSIGIELDFFDSLFFK